MSFLQVPHTPTQVAQPQTDVIIVVQTVALGVLSGTKDIVTVVVPLRPTLRVFLPQIAPQILSIHYLKKVVFATVGMHRH